MLRGCWGCRGTPGLKSRRHILSPASACKSVSLMWGRASALQIGITHVGQGFSPANQYARAGPQAAACRLQPASHVRGCGAVPLLAALASCPAVRPTRATGGQVEGIVGAEDV